VKSIIIPVRVPAWWKVLNRFCIWSYWFISNCISESPCIKAKIVWFLC